MNLKALKKRLKQEEQAFKRIKKCYPYLSSMSNNDILVYLHLNSTQEIITYAKQLRSEETHTQKLGNDECQCLDANGVLKNLYTSKKDAERTRIHITHTLLKIYPCPTTNGWHLTKI